MKDDFMKLLNELLKDLVQDYYLPGLSVAIKKSGEKSLTACAGYSNYISKNPLKENTIFHMASISKLFTGAGILLLANDGAFSIDQPLKELLPWFKIAGSNDQERSGALSSLTVRKILSHTSGLPDLTDYRWDLASTHVGALKEYCMSEDVTKRSLLWSPNLNKFSYSNIGYELLGTLIEEYSGQTFEDFIKGNFFVPLGMSNSNFATYERSSDNSLSLIKLEEAGLAMPHSKDSQNNIILEKYYPYNRAHGPSSTLTATLSDILLWGDAWIKKEPLVAACFAKENPFYPVAALSNSDEKIGLSWFIREEGGLTFYGHEGSDDGFRSSFWICPLKEVSILVCSNLSRAPVKKINKLVFEIIKEAL